MGVASLLCFSQLANLPGSFPTAKAAKKNPKVSCSTGAFLKELWVLQPKHLQFNGSSTSEHLLIQLLFGGSGVELMNMPMQPGDARGEDKSFRVL